jgi:alpha-tubulin suppressor-like RCC1 family protein
MTQRYWTNQLLSSALLALYAASGCASDHEEQCTSNAECLSAGHEQGVCLPDSHCAYPDIACRDTGLRYASASGAQGSACAPRNRDGSCLTQLTLGIDFTCALKNDGSVWCWGTNDHGQLGDGQPAGDFSGSPRRVALPVDFAATEIGAGEIHACALSSSGSVWCWGGGDSLQLGQGSADAEDHLTPVEAIFPSRVVAVHSLSVGAAHNCVVDQAGTVWCWGENDHREAGQNSLIPCPSAGDSQPCQDVSSPTPIASDLSAIAVMSGDEFSCLIDDLSELRCWGDNSLGELGIGTTTPLNTEFAQMTGLGSFLTVDTDHGTPLLALGAEHACVVAGGSVQCWGSNGAGQVGVGTKSASEPSPHFVETAHSVLAGSMAKHTCSVESDSGHIMCWGANADGQLGLGHVEEALVPTEVPIAGMKHGALGATHSCMLIGTGALYCWGSNAEGELGITPSRVESSPIVSDALAKICH